MYTTTSVYVQLTVDPVGIHQLDQRLVIHRQMLWYSCTGSTFSYTYTDVMVYSLGQISVGL
jgi:hypothetical protein